MALSPQLRLLRLPKRKRSICASTSTTESRVRTRANKGNKGKGKGKDKGKKGKGKGKGKICPFYNDTGCNNGSACKMLHEAPAMASEVDQAPANLAPKAKVAAAPKAAAADPSKP